MAHVGFMDLALELAREAALRGEVPVGAVLVRNRQVVAAAANRMHELADATAHAEILVIRKVSEILQTERLTDCDLYVTLEPCTMCATAISFARIRRLYFGAADEKGGAVEHGVRFYSAATCHHAPEVYSGLCESEAAAQLRTFFAERRSRSDDAAR